MYFLSLISNMDLFLDMREGLCSATVGYENGKGSSKDILCKGGKQF